MEEYLQQSMPLDLSNTYERASWPLPLSLVRSVSSIRTQT